jgi:hypothetical protein
MEGVVSGEKLDENVWCNLHSERVCLCHSHKMQQNCCISNHEMVMVYKLHIADYEEKLNYVSWYTEEVYAGETNPTLVLFGN